MLKVLSIGEGSALDAFSVGRAGKNDLQHVRINKEYPFELDDYDWAQLNLAEVICIQGTWGSTHQKRNWNILESKDFNFARKDRINSIIAQYAKDNNKPLIVFETMTLSRIRQNYISNRFEDILPKYYRMGLSHWMFNRAKFLTNHNDHLRLKMMHSNFKTNYDINLNIHNHKWNNNKEGNILLISGLEHDPTNEDVYTWIIASIEKIRQHSNRTIVIKKHPLSKLDLTPIVNQFDNVVQNKHYKDKLQTFVPGTFVAVIDNSTSIFELADLGIPCFCNKDSFGSILGNTDLSNIEKPYYANTTEYVNWAQRMSYTEFTVEELMSWTILDKFIELVEMY